MSTQESESALDAIVQQTWKRARTSREIGAFIARLSARNQLSADETGGVLAQEDFELVA